MSDPGLEALAVIHRTLMIDDPWTVRGARNFWWIGRRLAAQVDASPMFASLGLSISRVTTSIDVVEDVGSARAEVELLLRALNFVTLDSAYVYFPLERTIRAMCAHNVHEETVQWRSRELASAHITALVLAERHADQLAERLNGTVARRVHPQSGERRVPDDMLNVLERHYAPRGAEINPFRTSDEMHAVYDTVRGTFDFSAGSSPEGVAIEVAFGESETTLIELKTDEPHPLVGNGLGVFMTLRVTQDLAQCCHLANEMNRLQFAEGESIAALGAWTVRTIGERHNLARARFVANANYVRNRAVDCAQSAIGQALWADNLFNPGVQRRSSLPAVARAMGFTEPGQ